MAWNTQARPHLGGANSACLLSHSAHSNRMLQWTLYFIKVITPMEADIELSIIHYKASSSIKNSFTHIHTRVGWQKDKHRNSMANTPAPWLPHHTTLDKLFTLSTSSVINRSQWWMSHNNLTIWSKAVHIEHLGGSCHTASVKSIYVLIISPRKPSLHCGEAFLLFPPPCSQSLKRWDLTFWLF